MDGVNLGNVKIDCFLTNHRADRFQVYVCQFEFIINNNRQISIIFVCYVVVTLPIQTIALLISRLVPMK